MKTDRMALLSGLTVWICLALMWALAGWKMTVALTALLIVNNINQRTQ